MDGALKNSTINEIETIPFKLTDQEAVVVYKDKGSLKYTKINLLKKKVLEPPM